MEPFSGGEYGKDFQFAKWMAKTHNLLCIPPSAFYSKEHRHLAGNYIRLNFFKKNDSLDEAAKIFSRI